MLNLTFKERTDSPHRDGTLRGELSKGHLQHKERETSGDEEHQVGNQKRTCKEKYAINQSFNTL